MTATTMARSSDLRALVADPHPVVSVYLNLQPPAATTDVRRDVDLRWRAMAGRLRADGADPETLAEIGVLLDRHLAPFGTMAVFAGSDRVLHSTHLYDLPTADRASYGAPPQILPLIRFEHRRPAHVVVVTDRLGADITEYADGAMDGSTTVVAGPDDEIERSWPGGGMQPKHQRRAEDSWAHNAQAVATAALDALARVQGQLILIAGDPRMVTLFQHELDTPAHHQVMIVQVPGGRSYDGSEAARRAAIDQALIDYAMARDTALLHQFAAVAPGLRAEGASATIAALAEGRVAMLLVVDDPDDQRSAWFARDLLCAEFPQLIAADAAVQQGRLVDVAVRAALLTDADVRVLDPAAAANLAEGIGAICRFD